MNTDTIFQLYPVQILSGIMGWIKISASSHSRLFHETILNSLGQGILIHYVFKLDRSPIPLHLGSSGKFQPKNGIQFIDDLHPPISSIVMGFIHQ
ncbi:MAG: hypothetical protein AB1611_16880 [bacterium]